MNYVHKIILLFRMDEIINERLPNQVCAVLSGAGIWYFYFRPQIHRQLWDKEMVWALCPEERWRQRTWFANEMLRAHSFSSGDFALGKIKLRRERVTCYLQRYKCFVKSCSQQSYVARAWLLFQLPIQSSDVFISMGFPVQTDRSFLS